MSRRTATSPPGVSNESTSTSTAVSPDSRGCWLDGDDGSPDGAAGRRHLDLGAARLAQDGRQAGPVRQVDGERAEGPLDGRLGRIDDARDAPPAVLDDERLEHVVERLGPEAERHVGVAGDAPAVLEVADAAREQDDPLDGHLGRGLGERRDGEEGGEETEAEHGRGGGPAKGTEGGGVWARGGSQDCLGASEMRSSLKPSSCTSAQPMRPALLCVLAALLTGCLYLGESADFNERAFSSGSINLGLQSEVEVSDAYAGSVRPTSSLAVVVGGATVGDGTFRETTVPTEEQEVRFFRYFLTRIDEAFEPVEIGRAGPGVRGFDAQQVRMSTETPAEGARLEFPEFAATHVLLIPELEVYHFLPGEDLPSWYVSMYGRESTGTRLEVPFTLWDNQDGAVIATGRIEVATLPADNEALVRDFAIEFDRLTPIGTR